MPDSKRPRPPPTLGKIRSEFETLCDEHGGPAPVKKLTDGLRDALDHACVRFHFAMCLNAYSQWAPDEPTAFQHWPWVAFAASQYRLERTEKKKYKNDEPTPSEIKTLLTSVAKDARGLRQKLIQLHALSARLGDETASDRRAHLAWLDQFISQNLLGSLPEVIQHPEMMLAAHSAKVDLCIRLAQVEISAREAKERVMPGLLQRARTQGDRGVRRLVSIADPTWQSLTGRVSSSNKVRPRAGSHDDRPDFAIFVSNIAELACNHTLTREQVAIALRPAKATRKKTK